MKNDTENKEGIFPKCKRCGREFGLHEANETCEYFVGNPFPVEKKEWESRFDEQFTVDGKGKYWSLSSGDVKNVKSFISQELETARKEVVEKAKQVAIESHDIEEELMRLSDLLNDQ